MQTKDMQSLPTSQRKRQSGFSFLSLVGALLIIGVLYVVYMNMRSGADTVTVGQEIADTSRDMACQLNRQALERSITTWAISHPGTEPTIDGLRRDGVAMTPCPEGGQFSIQGRSVLCSVHR